MTTTSIYRGIELHYDEYKAPGLEWNPTFENLKNLVDLASALRNMPPPKFDMETYAAIDHFGAPETEEVFITIDAALNRVLGITDYNTPLAMYLLGKAGKPVAHACGTSCCAVGTAAFVGIGIHDEDDACLQDDGWDDYMSQAFGFDTGFPWVWCFAGDWARWQPKAEQAAARILALVCLGASALEERVGYSEGAQFLRGMAVITEYLKMEIK